jgi:hypothetical protein
MTWVRITIAGGDMALTESDAPSRGALSCEAPWRGGCQGCEGRRSDDRGQWLSKGWRITVVPLPTCSSVVACCQPLCNFTLLPRMPYKYLVDGNVSDMVFYELMNIYFKIYFFPCHSTLSSCLRVILLLCETLPAPPAA